jgi:hypothetical protein
MTVIPAARPKRVFIFGMTFWDKAVILMRFQGKHRHTNKLKIGNKFEAAFKSISL